MKWKTVIVLFVIAFTGFIGLILGYNFDTGELTSLAFYQNLANPSMKVVNIKEGLRKEEVASVLAKKLNWNDQEKKEFLSPTLALAETNLEGRYFPKTYLIHKDSDPEDVRKIMTDEFQKKVSTIKKSKTTTVLNEKMVLIVASMIQREAAGPQDMKLISGIIWNRIFEGMKLQVDATLQYAKGTEKQWWPPVLPKDKKIESPYNTYLYDMPPTPISNPGLAAIEAAYNPQKTSCMFYLHDKLGKIHCSKTYEQHKRYIDLYY